MRALSFPDVMAGGGQPKTRLVQVGGFLYGTTSRSSASGQGTIFSFHTNVNTTFAASLVFSTNGPANDLMLASDGNLYGTTIGNGIGSKLPVLFRITTSGVYTNLYTIFQSSQAGLVQAGNGNLYGTIGAAGGSGGSIFVAPTNTLFGFLNNLYTFSLLNTTNGINPSGTLLLANDGNLYGTTISGGTNNDGTIFRITTNGVFTSLHSFSGSLDGVNPQGDLIQAGDGNLYGTTPYGGAYGNGTIFQISTNGVFNTIWSFTGGADGANPFGGVIQAGDGNLYGTAYNGGTNGYGTIFKLILQPVLYSASIVNSFSESNQTLVIWPPWANGYILQSVTNLASTNWVTVTNATPITGAVINNSSPARYFRLVKP